MNGNEILSMESDIEQINGALEQLRQAMRDMSAEGRDAFEAVRAPVESFNAELAALNESIAGGAASWGAYRQSIKQAQNDMRSVENTVQGIEGAVRGWSKSFSNAISDALMTGKLEFSDFASSILRDIIRIQTQAIFTEGVSGLSSAGGFLGGLLDNLGSALGGIFGSGESAAVLERHSGGIIGITPGPLRFEDPAIFASALRLHSGLAADEFPAILQSGEEVVSRSDRATILDKLNQSQGGSNVSINLVNNTGVQATAKKGSGGTRWDGKQWVQDIILEAVNGGNESLMYAIASLKG